MSPQLPDNPKSSPLHEKRSDDGDEKTSPPPRGKETSARDALSRWYLARLRKRAHMAAAGGNLTPAALIAADRDRIEKLIEENATDTGFSKTVSLPAIPKSRSSINMMRGIIITGIVVQVALIASSIATGAQLLSLGLSVLALAWTIWLTFFLLQFSRRVSKLRDEMLGEEVNIGVLLRIDELDCFRYLFQRKDQVADELREKERAIVDYSDDIVCSLDPDFKISSINPTPVRLLGYTSDELLGKPFLDFVLPVEKEKTEKNLNSARTMKREIGFETRLQKKDGNSIDLFWQSDWSRTSNAFFCVAHDITIRKNSERSRQEFVAMLSHDLRSPLASIQGSLALLRAGALGTLQEQVLTRVTSAERISNQLIRLINDLLDIEKIEAGKFELSKEEFSIAEIIKQSAEAIEALAEQKHVSLLLPESKCTIFADRDRLFRVLVNLLSNAIKFSRENTPVTVEIEEIGAFVEVRVRDNGRGIAKSDQAKIFDRFQQVEASDATIKGGSGLGLAICKAIVERHGGAISVESEVGVGSTFKFRLPVMKPATV